MAAAQLNRTRGTGLGAAKPRRDVLPRIGSGAGYGLDRLGLLRMSGRGTWAQCGGADARLG